MAKWWRDSWQFVVFIAAILAVVAWIVVPSILASVRESAERLAACRWDGYTNVEELRSETYCVRAEDGDILLRPVTPVVLRYRAREGQ